jgi:hypothetical protein|tara:strand:+ start:211 stop:501 length:291 start_codon:yes stop_codon:yes gene_type:complete
MKILIALGLITLTTCTSSSKIAFNRMTGLELASYNETVEMPQKVYCFEEVRTGTFIKKRYCFSLAELATELHDNALSLGTINYSPVNRYAPGYNDR